MLSSNSCCRHHYLWAAPDSWLIGVVVLVNVFSQSLPLHHHTRTTRFIVIFFKILFSPCCCSFVPVPVMPCICDNTQCQCQCHCTATNNWLIAAFSVSYFSMLLHLCHNWTASGLLPCFLLISHCCFLCTTTYRKLIAVDFSVDYLLFCHFFVCPFLSPGNSHFTTL